MESGYSSGTWTQTGGSPILPFTDNGLDMAVVDFATHLGVTFEFTFSTNDAQDPCTNVDAVISITVVDCYCPPIVLDSAPDLCNDSGMMDLCALTDGSDDGIPTVASIGGTDISGNITGCIFDATGLNPGEYVITFTLNETVTGICEQFLKDTFSISEFNTTTIMDPPEVCVDPDGNGLMSLNFTDYVDNAGIGTWEDTDGTGAAIATLPEQQNVSFLGLGLTPGSYTFTYRIDNEDPCEDVVLTMEVQITDNCNCPPIELTTPTAINNDDGTLDMCSLIGNSDPGTFTVLNQSGENQSANIDSTGCIFNATDIAPGTYSIIYTLDVQVPSICVQSVTVFVDVIELVATNSIRKDNIQIYPNPTSDKLNIKSDFKITSLNLYTETGNSIYKSQLLNGNNVEIDLSSYPSGLYLLQVETDMGRWIEKVIRR